MRKSLPVASAVSLEYESQQAIPIVRVVSVEKPMIEIFAFLVITAASVALCSLSWWMALHT